MTESNTPIVNQGLRLPTPPNFDGSTNVRHWIARLDAFFKSHGTVSEETKFNYACSLLDGPAIDWWLFTQSEIAEGNRTIFVSYKEFANALTNHFTPHSDIASAEKELADVRQTGSVADYLKIFSQIIVRIPDMKDAERRRCFVRGLKSSTQKEIYRQCPNSYKEACRIAQLFDHASFQLFTAPKNFYQVQSRPQFQDSSRMEIDQVSVIRPKKLSDTERDYLIKNRGCFSCRKLGHTAASCKLFPKQNSRFRTQVNELNVEPVLNQNEIENDKQDFHQDQ